MSTRRFFAWINLNPALFRPPLAASRFSPTSPRGLELRIDRSCPVLDFLGWNTAGIRKIPEPDWRAVERGWFLGDQEFKEELLVQMHGRRGDHYGPELREGELVQAGGVLKEELGRRRWAEEELGQRRKGDPEKVEIASELRGVRP